MFMLKQLSASTNPVTNQGFNLLLYSAPQPLSLGQSPEDAGVKE